MRSSPQTGWPLRATAARLARRAHLPVLGFVLLVAGAAGTAAMARPAPEGFADLAEQVSPAVVTVMTVRTGEPAGSPGEPGLPLPPDSPFREYFERFFGRELPEGQAPPQQPRQRAGVGSGFIMDPDGTVVTNNHVVAGAEEITVGLNDGRSFEAELVGRDERTDLAVLKIAAEAPLPFVSLGDSDGVRVGDWVMAVGNPFGLGGTVTAGIVSARGRDLAGGALIDFLQIDAAINRGNSGGPAFNGAGEVIGINTAIYSPNGGNVGIGFAIPSNLAVQVVAELRAHGRVERGWLGVRIQPVTPDVAEGFGLDAPRGALVASVAPDGPAAEAGLRAGDIVLAWNGRPVAKINDLPRLVAATPAGNEVEVTVWRQRRERSFTVETGRAPATEQVAGRDAGDGRPAGTEKVAGTGLVVADLNPRLRARFQVPAEVEGVVVVGVGRDGGTGAESLQPGDVIRSVALEPATSARQVARKVAAEREAGEDVVVLMISRQGSERFVPLRLADA